MGSRINHPQRWCHSNSSLYRLMPSLPRCWLPLPLPRWQRRLGVEDREAARSVGVRGERISSILGKLGIASSSPSTTVDCVKPLSGGTNWASSPLGPATTALLAKGPWNSSSSHCDEAIIDEVIVKGIFLHSFLNTDVKWYVLDPLLATSNASRD
ncbi:uncharacterized protein BCR38DRAFT_54353 [Pseudomassariella vexata]|uniref:Uncharacterized protein n=1 Tax=Pseudomassariella vexata TaxID=1141098 RepID=A0A1Y2DLW0_9PEZI|nr:uncharacterized protein BCR38DRAFT_54353 [Pseudomassariella vexata]ORY60129.1 hypothetical protein BCR38DRAFT_54353 [Pseudomassariella vexata]